MWNPANLLRILIAFALFGGVTYLALSVVNRFQAKAGSTL